MSVSYVGVIGEVVCIVSSKLSESSAGAGQGGAVTEGTEGLQCWAGMGQASEGS